MNKVTLLCLALLLIILITPYIALTGLSTGLVRFTITALFGNVNISVEQTLSIALPDPSTNFGSGYVNPGSAYAIIDSEGTKINWTNTSSFPDSDPMILVNNGNINANVSIIASKNAQQFLGGTSPEQKYKVVENESTACLGNIQSTYVNLSNSTYTLVCDNLDYSDATDSLKIHFRLKVPEDTPTGLKENTITFIAQAA